MLKILNKELIVSFSKEDWSADMCGIAIMRTIIIEPRSGDLKRRGNGSVTSAWIKGDSNFIRSLQTRVDPKQTIWQLLANPIAYPPTIWPLPWDMLATPILAQGSAVVLRGRSGTVRACTRNHVRELISLVERENAQLASSVQSDTC